jgi:hypothetical protein
MGSRAGWIAIIVTAIVMYLIDFGYYTLFMADMGAAMVERFGAIAYRMDELNPVLYFIPTLVGVFFMHHYLTRGGGNSTGAWVRSGAFFWGMWSLLFGLWWNLTFRDIPMMETVMGLAHDVVWGGIAGALLSVISTRLGRTS